MSRNASANYGTSLKRVTSVVRIIPVGIQGLSRFFLSAGHIAMGSEKNKPKRTRGPYAKRACVPCRRAKAKCDNARPCLRCVKMDLTGECVDFVNGSRRGRGRDRAPRKPRFHRQRKPKTPQTPPSDDDADYVDPDDEDDTFSDEGQFSVPDLPRPRPIPRLPNTHPGNLQKNESGPSAPSSTIPPNGLGLRHVIRQPFDPYRDQSSSNGPPLPLPFYTPPSDQSVRRGAPPGRVVPVGLIPSGAGFRRRPPGSNFGAGARQQHQLREFLPVGLGLAVPKQLPGASGSATLPSRPPPVPRSGGGSGGGSGSTSLPANSVVGFRLPQQQQTTRRPPPPPVPPVPSVPVPVPPTSNGLVPFSLGGMPFERPFSFPGGSLSPLPRELDSPGGEFDLLDDPTGLGLLGDGFFPPSPMDPFESPFYPPGQQFFPDVDLGVPSSVEAVAVPGEYTGSNEDHVDPPLAVPRVPVPLRQHVRYQDSEVKIEEVPDLDLAFDQEDQARSLLMDVVVGMPEHDLSRVRPGASRPRPTRVPQRFFGGRAPVRRVDPLDPQTDPIVLPPLFLGSFPPTPEQLGAPGIQPNPSIFTSGVVRPPSLVDLTTNAEVSLGDLRSRQLEDAIQRVLLQMKRQSELW